jgi:hypothetical protein
MSDLSSMREEKQGLSDEGREDNEAEKEIKVNDVVSMQ